MTHVCHDPNTRIHVCLISSNIQSVFLFESVLVFTTVVTTVFTSVFTTLFTPVTCHTGPPCIHAGMSAKMHARIYVYEPLSTHIRVHTCVCVCVCVCMRSIKHFFLKKIRNLKSWLLTCRASTDATAIANTSMPALLPRARQYAHGRESGSESETMCVSSHVFMCE
jgi:hypothetical protein